MGVEEKLRRAVQDVLVDLARAGVVPVEVARAASFSVERPKRPEHGDLASNVALAIAKPSGKPPRDVAAAVAEGLRKNADVREVDIAGPGFLNVRFHPSAFHPTLADVEAAGAGFGRALAATGERILVEF